MKTTNTLLDNALNERRKEIKAKFKSSWIETDFATIKKALRKHFTFKPIQTREGVKTFYTFNDFNMFAGLAYTSHSSAAMYSICNTEVFDPKYPGYRYVCFELSEDNKPYATLWDKDENEIIIEL